MTLETYVPRAPLASFVEFLWLSQGDPAPHRRERVLPSGTMQLIVGLREEKLRVYDRHRIDQFQYVPASLLVGMQTEYAVIDTAPQAAMMGVLFKPGGAWPFFPCGADELQNAQVPLECLWGREAEVLRTRLLEAKTSTQKFQTMEQALTDRAVRPLDLHPAVTFALGEFQAVPHQKTVAQVANQISLSPRWFIEVFSASVGLTPKLYCRVRRFQEVLHLLGGGQSIDLTEVGLTCGYFDQAHFIHDFQDFSGINPTTYVARRTEYANHVALL